MVLQRAGQDVGVEELELLAAEQVEDQPIGVAAAAEHGRQPSGRSQRRLKIR